MAKGGRGGRRGGGVAKGELKLPDGSKIEFDGELKFGAKDPALNPTVRKNIESWEAKRANAKVEYAYSVDANGNPIGRGEIRGGKGSVRTPYSYHSTPDATFTHIHPRGDGMLGGTFSDADLSNFAYFGNKTERAKAKEGTYSISKDKGFDAKGFMSYAKSSQSKHRDEYTKKVDNLVKTYRTTDMSYDDYLKGNAKAFNTYLVKRHNDLIAGQKKYGYKYTLEK